MTMQIVKVECQECGAVNTYELDGCVIAGRRANGDDLFVHHNISHEQVVTIFHKAFPKEKKLTVVKEAIRRLLRKYVG